MLQEKAPTPNELLASCINDAQHRTRTHFYSDSMDGIYRMVVSYLGTKDEVNQKANDAISTEPISEKEIELAKSLGIK